jgi:hypothetical protein
MTHAARTRSALTIAASCALAAGALTAVPSYAHALTPTAATIDLDSAPVPRGMCRHSRGHLVDGKRDFGVKGQEWIEDVARGRMGGGSVAVASIGCTAGGVSWPSTLVFYGRTPGGYPKLLAHLYLGKFRASEHANVKTMRAAGGVLNVRWVTYNGCCFERQKYSASMRLRGNKVNVWDVTKGRVTHPYPKL